MAATRDTYIHCFGRHLETSEWERIMIGSDEAYGQIPMLLAVIDRNASNVHTVGFGTGASHRGGISEAKIIFDRADQLAKSPKGFSRRTMASDIRNKIIDDESKNTEAELKTALKYMKDNNLTRFVGVTCPSHAPRCMATAIAVMHGTGIQIEIVSSETIYPNSMPDDVTVFEPPHLPRDVRENSRLHLTLKEYFKLSPIKKRKFERLVEDLFAELT